MGFFLIFSFFLLCLILALHMLEPNQPPASRASEWCFFPLTVLTSSHISLSYFEVCVESHVVLCDSLWHCREDVCYTATHTVTPSALQSIHHAVVCSLAYVWLCAALCSVTILSICPPWHKTFSATSCRAPGTAPYCDISDAAFGFVCYKNTGPLRNTCRRRSLVIEWDALP